MPNLYIRGETGKTLGPARQEIGALKIRDAAIRLETLDTDTLTWTARTLDVDAGQTTVPDVGQKVSLYLDETRLFAGHVTAPQVLLHGLRVEVVGTWWWLLRADAVSDQEDEEATSAERPVLKFASGSWADHISSVLDLARDGYALPVREGTIATGYDIPAVSYSLTTLAEVISRLLEWCGDAQLWVDHSALSGEVAAATSTTVQLGAEASSTDDDYNGLEIEIRSGANAGETRVISDYVGATKTATVSVAWTTTPSAGDDYTLEIEPRINVSRRGSMTADTLAIGTDPIVEPFDLRQLVELELSQVVLPYVDRDATTDALQYQEQASGTYASGKRQIVVVSGPEIADFLPQDVASVADFQHEFTTTSNDLKTAIEAAWPGYADFEATYAEGGSNWVLGVANVAATGKTVSDTGGEGSKTGGSWTQATKAADRRWIIFETTPPQWAIDDYQLQKWTPSHLYFVDGNSGTATPAYVYERRVGLLSLFSPTWYWFSNSKSDPIAAGAFEYLWAVREFLEDEFTLWTIPLASIPASGPLLKGGGLDPYSFFEPPAGLAANMLAAAGWLPWQGQASRRIEDLAVGAPLSKKWNVTGSPLAAAATAGALLQGYDLDLAARLETLRFGPPARLSYRGLVDRTQRNPQDNIIEL